jgi:hypothetical protein
MPILDSTFRRTTSARRPSKSMVPPRRAASSASSYFIPVGLPSCVISTVYQRPVRKALRPGLYGAPAFIVLLAALLLSSRSWRDRSLCALEALRGTSGGETMTTPGGAGTTLWTACLKLTRARPTGFYHGVGAPWLQGSGPSLCPTPKPQGVSYVQVSGLESYIRNIIPTRI